MTALITSNIYSNYTADFAFLGGAISRFKPNKIVSSNPLPLRELPSTNLLRNRTVAKPKNRLGERVQNLFKRKTKETPKPYNLRSAQLDTEEGRKIISTANQNLKQNSGVTRYSWQKPLQNIENPNQTKTSRVYNSRVEARIKSPSYGRKIDAEAIKQSKPQVVSRPTNLKPLAPLKQRPSTASKSNDLIQKANESLNRTRNLARDNSRTKAVRAKQRRVGKGKSFLREDLTRTTPQWGFQTENWRA